MARKLIKGSKDLYYSLISHETLSQEIGLLDQPITLSKNYKTYPNHDMINQKPPTQNLKYFLILNYKTFRVCRGFEQLFSSICSWVMAGQNLSWECKSYLSCSFLFLPKIGFLSHNFGSRYARKPIKGSKDWAENGLLHWGPGPGKLGQRGRNMPPLWCHPQKTPNSKQKNHF